MRAFAIGPAQNIHLEHSQLQTQLEFFCSVVSSKTPRHDLARLPVPIPDRVCNIKTHTNNLSAERLAVNCAV